MGRPTSLHDSIMMRTRSSGLEFSASRLWARSISTTLASVSSLIAMAAPPSDMMLIDRPR